MIPQYLTGELIHAGDLPLKHGDDVHVIPGVLIKIEREVIAAAPTLPMYQQVAIVPQAEIQKLSDTVLGALASAERDMANHRRLLAWFIEQFRGESGAGESHWEQYPEYREALRLIEHNPT